MMTLMYLLALIISSLWAPHSIATSHPASYKATCKAIGIVLSRSSGIFYPGSAQYELGNSHWDPSSSENSTCVVEPGTSADVSRILKVLALSTTPFGIKSGGHATILGFSSTQGVQISLSRFNQTIHNKHKQTADIGPGQAWDTVYDVLQSQGVMVPGGRISGVGVGGFVLGGGYSWLSNSVGLAIDNVVEFELVLPNGKIVEVNEESEPDLFFGLTGGFNNFGIVTRITMKAYPQGHVWGGNIDYSGGSVYTASKAIIEYHETNKDSQSSLLTAYSYSDGAPKLSITLLYNGTSAPHGLFDRFLSIPYDSKDLVTRNFTSFISAISSPYGYTPPRGAIGSYAVADLSLGILNQVINATGYFTDSTRFVPGSSLEISAEPFLKAPLSAPDYSRTAYPHFKYASPGSIFYSWPNATYDEIGHKVIQDVSASVMGVATLEGQNLTDVSVYPNYSLADEPLQDMYNVNLDRLRALRKKVDPKGLMLRAGGFKFV